jgi:asparagine synthase (glutamine-hydrolysing)
MPGFHLTVHASGLPLNKAQTDEQDGSEIIFQQQNIRLKMNSYPGYPFEVFDFGEIKVLFEGMIYNRTKVEIQNFVSSICAKSEPDQKEIENWIRSVDGEFVFVVIRLSEVKIQIFNDLFGRLPLYYTQAEGEINVSRDIAAIRASCRIIDYEPFSVASSLIFGFVPGLKTLWKGIYRFTPASLMELDTFSHQDIVIRKIYDFTERSENKEVIASELLNLLAEATQNRIRLLLNPALSLSGGLDSRLIAGILAKNKLHIPLFTYQDEAGSALADIESVKEMIKILAIQDQHTFFKLGNSGKTELDVLLQCKQGLNYLGMAFLVPYLKHFSDNKLQQITGDGGDKVLADLRPLVRLKNKDDFWKYLKRRHTSGSIVNILKLCSISENNYRNELEKILFNDDSSDFDDAYIRFLLLGRAQVWLFEGEDRNRCFGWSTSPFYSPDFALKALNLPMESKAFGKIFLEMFRQLGSGLEHIPNPNWQQSPEEQAAIRKLFFKQELKHRLPDFVQNLFASGQSIDLHLVNPELSSMIRLASTEALFPDWFQWQTKNIDWVRNEDLGWHLLTLFKLWERF